MSFHQVYDAGRKVLGVGGEYGVQEAAGEEVLCLDSDPKLKSQVQLIEWEKNIEILGGKKNI